MGRTMGSEDGWRAIHLFYHADHDIALTRIVAPVVDRSVRDGAIRQRFVLRHWEGGPHIRIRVLPNATVDPDDVTGGLMADLEEALATEPSHAELDPTAFQAACRHFAELEGQMSDPAPLGKDNTLAQKPYVREYGKYGGPAGMETAERVFDTSTTLAFAALPGLVSSSQARHGHAFAMMLIAAIGFGLARRDLRDWFTTYQGVWGVGANAAEQAGWGRSLDRLRPPLGRIAQTCLHGSGMDP